jgi:hypothetical protein
MRNGSRSRAWRWLTSVIALAIGLGMLPGLLAPAPAAAQAEEITQREFANLIDDAQADDPAFGPEEGELELDPEAVAFSGADLEISDFLAVATFQNPYAGTRQQFDYGIQFRSSGSGRSVQYVRFIVLSDGTWGVVEGTDNVLQTGTYEDLDNSRRGENELTVYAEGSVAHVGINGDYVGSAELPFDDAGDVYVGSAYLPDSYQDGAVTGFTDFTVWELGGGSSKPGKKKTPTPAEEDTPVVEGTTYESPTYGYTLVYDDTWEAKESSRRGTDTIELSNGVSTIGISGTKSTDTPTECVDALIDGFESDDSITDVTVAVDENDDEMRGEIDGGEFVVLQTTVDGDNGPADLTVYYSCIPIVEGESMLGITHVTAAADYNDEVENRVTLLDTLSIDGSSTKPSTGGKKTPTPESTATSELPEGSVTFYLESVEENGPIVFGTLIPARAKTDVSVLILAFEQGASPVFEVTIHEGTCRRPGPATFELGTSDDVGLLDATVNLPVEDLSNGDYVMLVSEDGTADTAVACGPLVQIEEDSQG